jgi:divalent metal cation (Fe/Co/Zn/Cd) transporter
MALSRKSRAAALPVASNATLVVLKLVVGVVSQSVSVLSEAHATIYARDPSLNRSDRRVA